MSDRSLHLPAGRVFQRLLRLLRPQWGRIALGVLLLLLSMPAELFPAFIWLYVADGLAMKNMAGRSVRFMHALCSLGGRITEWPGLLVSALAWLTVIYVIGETLQTLSGWIMQRVAQRFILGLRNTVYGKLQSQSLGYLQHQRTGDLMSRAMGDVDELQSFTVNSIDVIIGEGLMWLVTVITVMLIDWRVASASLAPLVLVYVLLRVFNKRVAPIYRAAREKAGDVSTRLQENLSGVTVIKIFGREKAEAERFRGETEAYYDQQLKAINARSLYFPFTRAVGFLSNVNMIGLGGYLILTGQGFTVGKLVMFRSYWWRLFGPVQTLARVNDMVQRAVAAARRVFEVLDAPEELPDAAGAKAVDSVKGDMALRGVTFSYSRSTVYQPVSNGAKSAEGDRSPVDSTGHGPVARATSVLHDLSIDIPSGKTVALCGPSGSGKSTILNLLLRFYDPTAGQVMLDGVDLRQIERHSLRKHFALVQQESFLFNDSILDNIRYGQSGATMDEVIAATKAANAHGFISQMPAGYDTKVGERGVRLSGGQKQRLSIARAFLANPSILLLDEPTSSVEPDSEAAIIAALGRLMQGRTTVITSHRPSLIQQADIVYVIQDGRVTGSGSVEELIERDEWFARFMRSEEEELAADGAQMGTDKKTSV